MVLSEFVVSSTYLLSDNIILSMFRKRLNRLLTWINIGDYFYINTFIYFSCFNTWWQVISGEQAVMAEICDHGVLTIICKKIRILCRMVKNTVSKKISRKVGNVPWCLLTFLRLDSFSASVCLWSLLSDSAYMPYIPEQQHLCRPTSAWSLLLGKVFWNDVNSSRISHGRIKSAQMFVAFSFSVLKMVLLEAVQWS